MSEKQEVLHVDKIDPTKATSAINPDLAAAVLSGCSLNGVDYPDGKTICYLGGLLTCVNGSWKASGLC